MLTEPAPRPDRLAEKLRVRGRVALDPKPIDAEPVDVISRRLERIVAEPAEVGTRSERHYALIAQAVEEGFTDGQVLTLVSQHAPSFEKFDTRLEAETRRVIDKVRPTSVAVRTAPDLVIAPTLGDDVWNARPALAQIREASRHYLVAPYAVLIAVLARIIAYTHPYLGLPPIPRYGSLNLLVNLVGPSGQGKGASIDLSKRLIAAPELSYLELPAGSGEGMVRSFFTKEDIGGDAKRQQWRQTVQSVLFRVDEGRFLKALGERSGQTTIDVLLSGFSGEQLGGNYVDPDRRGIIAPAHTYRMVVVTGIQPENAQFLLDDHISGFPQRMVWAACVDPDAPPLEERPDDPGPLKWQPPDYREAERVWLPGNGKDVEVRHALAVAPAVNAEILERRHAITTGRIEPNPLDSHRDLVQLKVAGALALLDERVDINIEDWELARTIVDTSGRVRTWVQQRIEARHAADETFATARTKRRAAAAEDGRAEQATIERKAVAMARFARGHGAVTKGELRNRLKSTERHGLFDRVFGMVLAREWLRPVDGEPKFETTATEDDSAEWPL